MRNELAQREAQGAQNKESRLLDDAVRAPKQQNDVTVQSHLMRNELAQREAQGAQNKESRLLDDTVRAPKQQNDVTVQSH
jgi:hypothetical protein